MFITTAAVVCALAQQVGEGVSPEAAAWVAANAVELKSCEAGKGFEDLSRLKDMVGDARIVSLGEPTHGTREAFQLKHRLMEYLATEMGFRVFSIEANMPESYKLNQYVLEGKGDPKELIGGMYFWTWNTEEVLVMVEWMRRFNEEGRAREGSEFVPLRFTGFDMQTPDVAATIVMDGVRDIDAGLVEEMRGALGRLQLAQRQAYEKGDSGGNSGGTAIMVGSFPPDAAKGKKAKVSAWIRTKEVGGFAGWWFRCDKADNTPGAFNNMAEFGPKGTTEWKRYEFTLDVPADTVNINFGPIVIGGGEAWFDDVEIELDSVKYENAELFSFDFENPKVMYLRTTTAGTTAKRVEEGVHGGKFSLYLSPKSVDVAKVDPAEVESETAKLAAKLIGMRDSLTTAKGAEQAEWIIQNGAVVAQCAQMVAAGPMAGGAVRDECMAQNVKWIIDQDPRARVVLWAHNGHVSRQAGFGQKWMGGHLEEMYPGEMVVFGFATGEGTYTAMEQGKGLKSDNALQKPPAGSVEAHLDAAGKPVLLLDVRGASAEQAATKWAARPTAMRSIGAIAMQQQFYPQNPMKSYDILVYIKTSTASRLINR